jgi:2-polyprenyl-3-methyl-5-hydroxy-6-metoxy-1,4-benzoquinol methylase
MALTSTCCGILGGATLTVTELSGRPRQFTGSLTINDVPLVPSNSQIAGDTSCVDPMPPAPDVTRLHRGLALAYGLLCHAAFAVGVGTMIAAMLFGMSRSFGTVPAPWSIFTDALLLLQFPLLHSVLLTRPGVTVLRQLSPRAISTAMTTTTYALVASIQTFLLFALWTPSGTIWWRAEALVFWLIVGLNAVSWLLLLKAIWDAGPALQIGLLGWWAVVHKRSPAYPLLPTKGLFRVVRQPIYVAFSLTLWTVPTWTPDQLAVAIVLTIYCLVGPLLKENRFRQYYGSSFRTYAARVPYWLPWPRPVARRDDLAIHDASVRLRSGETRWPVTPRNLVPTRFSIFDPIVGGRRRKDVLDLVGSGGFITIAFTDRGAKITAMASLLPSTASVRQRSGSNAMTINVGVGSGDRPPYADGVFDIVVWVDVLEHIRDRNPGFLEIRCVQRRNGLPLFDTINKTPLASLLTMTVGENVIRCHPRGSHDPATFRRRGLNRPFDLSFGFLPIVAIKYPGQAEAQALIALFRTLTVVDSIAIRGLTTR